MKFISKSDAEELGRNISNNAFINGVTHARDMAKYVVSMVGQLKIGNESSSRG